MTAWQQVSIDGETHVKKMTDQYEEFGFQVRLEEVKPAEVEQCIECLQERDEKIYQICVPRKQEVGKYK